MVVTIEQMRDDPGRRPPFDERRRSVAIGFETNTACFCGVEEGIVVQDDQFDDFSCLMCV